ncbi:hypothetical protein H310_04704 [Aphanomyces invadans]|uniref:Uncharacterized protein n=1 Tax=Aphanomyces invadans TaxID=157072 RepID=A0A024UEZ6_9STRA|nr:hypothetical protein H310_04704 [Aphanomyces invadans]ETW04427.1 hypothetical protein H310_04704 [Aphanomyces invadans]|eukprot:XP_008867383.1 hypothetical protein H310_04704 [Aphanomyces invadans]
MRRGQLPRGFCAAAFLVMQCAPQRMTATKQAVSVLPILQKIRWRSTAHRPSRMDQDYEHSPSSMYRATAINGSASTAGNPSARAGTTWALFPKLFEAPNVMIEFKCPANLSSSVAEFMARDAGAKHVHVRRDGVIEVVCSATDIDVVQGVLAPLGPIYARPVVNCPKILSRDVRNMIATTFEYCQIAAAFTSPYLVKSLAHLSDHGDNATVAASVVSLWVLSLLAGSMVPRRSASPHLVLSAATASFALTPAVYYVLYC